MIAENYACAYKEVIEVLKYTKEKMSIKYLNLGFYYGESI